MPKLSKERRYMRNNFDAFAAEASKIKPGRNSVVSWDTIKARLVAEGVARKKTTTLHLKIMWWRVKQERKRSDG